MLLLDYLFYIIREYRMLTCLGLGVGAAGLLVWYGKLSPGQYQARLWLGRGLKLLLLLTLTVLFFGRVLSRAYVLRYGQPGTGVVISSSPTIATVNKHRVMARKTLLRLADGRSYETSFDDQSANVYGANEGWNHLAPLPATGQPFAVRYLPHLPSNFLIMADDESTAFGQQVQCQPLRLQYAEAYQAWQFAKANPDYQQQLTRCLDALISSRCIPDDERAQYRELRKQVHTERQ